MSNGLLKGMSVITMLWGACLISPHPKMNEFGADLLACWPTAMARTFYALPGNVLKANEVYLNLPPDSLPFPKSTLEAIKRIWHEIKLHPSQPLKTLYPNAGTYLGVQGLAMMFQKIIFNKLCRDHDNLSHRLNAAVVVGMVCGLPVSMIEQMLMIRQSLMNKYPHARVERMNRIAMSRACFQKPFLGAIFGCPGNIIFALVVWGNQGALNFISAGLLAATISQPFELARAVVQKKKSPTLSAEWRDGTGYLKEIFTKGRIRALGAGIGIRIFMGIFNSSVLPTAHRESKSALLWGNEHCAIMRRDEGLESERCYERSTAIYGLF